MASAEFHLIHCLPLLKWGKFGGNASSVAIFYPQVPLTALQINQSKPAQKPYRMPDGGGLFLDVRPTGKKVWRLKYRFDGKEQLLTIGHLTDVPLLEARKRREEAKAQLRNKQDPRIVKKAKERERRLAQADSFEAIAREWFGVKSTHWSPAHAQRVWRSIEKDALPILGVRPISEIIPAEILDVLRTVEARGALSYAGDVLQRTGAVFRYAKITGRLKSNPAEGLSEARRRHVVKHMASIDYREMPSFMERLDCYRGHEVTKLALELLARLWTRPGELRHAEWVEFNIGEALWVIPAHKMKARREHVVPLSNQVLELLEQVRSYTGRYQYVLAGFHSPRKPISENTFNKALRSLGYSKEQATAHGFRSTASTCLNENGFNPDAIERQLAHLEENEVRAAYNRAKYLDERREMMRWWSDYLDGAVSLGGEVVPISENSKRG